MDEPVALPITEASQVGEARRIAAALAGRRGFDATGRGKVARVVTEAATNLVKHAWLGELVLRPLRGGVVGGLEVLALDRGPGMADVGHCLANGYSTAGSPGTGLGAITRLSDEFDIPSLPGVGTALLARLWTGPLPAAGPDPGLEIGAVCLPRVGGQPCGDAWAVAQRDGWAVLLVVDGLGQGLLAAEASREALRVVHEQAGREEPVAIVQAAHAALKGTRGAVLAVAELDLRRWEVRFVGVGNIAGSILPSPVPRPPSTAGSAGSLVPTGEGRSTGLVSHNGTVGHEARKVQEFSYPWPPGALLVLHADGLATQWRLDRYPGLAVWPPGLIAGVLSREHRRGRDDVTVLVTRQRPREEDS